MECCNTLQYLEGAAYIAIVLAVIGVPHMLTYYFERRERAADRAAAERRHQETRAAAERAERCRQEERADAERQRRADQADAERRRQEERTEADRRRQDERAEADRRRQDEQAAAERRHLEMMTALVAIAERNGHPPPAPAANPDASNLIAQMQQRIADLENNVHELQHQRNGNGNTNGSDHG